jgi:ribose 5-phosphate isomerase A
VAETPDIHASPLLRWPQEITHLEQKQEVAERAATRVKDGQVIGIGSGSNTYLVLIAIGQRVKRDGLKIAVVASSYETETAAQRFGLALFPLGTVEPEWGVDGADEVDPDNRLIKGRGGAMFREKILWSTSRQMYLAVDPSKYVDRLGSRFPIPIEVHRTGVDLLARALDEFGSTHYEMRLATGKDGPVITESGNLIIDAHFDNGIEQGLGQKLKALPGVIETGLFEGFSFEPL